MTVCILHYVGLHVSLNSLARGENQLRCQLNDIDLYKNLDFQSSAGYRTFRSILLNPNALFRRNP